ncbi:CaiB/BaiF CoA-transferase family protein [Pseudarthrobacter sp. B4EP4b]|uniref:CaiB/BaiF CoA transferase family protein n=1 Tax=Pseudarthrobacter sp. B4EP4b TaxID=2590664 RepID=UPI0011535975|nr:CoA transferase [Pseudarthrobacter sp. B4EP4b]
MNALEGVRVLDLSMGIAGPVAGMLLGDFGADVVKVEPRTGDPARSEPGFTVWNRNKRSVVRCPDKAEDRAWMAETLAAADVCLLGEQELGVWGEQALRAAEENLRLVVLKMPPYLDGLTPWGEGESNGLLAAYGGQATRQSSCTGGPVETLSPYMLYIHGIWAATCTVAALVERTTSGRGQTVTVTGANALMEATVSALSVDPIEPDPETAIGPSGRHPTYRPFRTADGTWISSGALGPKFEPALLQALGCGHILSDPRIDGQTARMSLPENREWVLPEITAAFASRGRDELLELMDSIGVPCGPAQSREEWFDSEQINAIGMKVKVEDPVLGEVVMPGVPVKLTGSPGSIRSAAPALGAHTDDKAWQRRDNSGTQAPRYVEGPLAGFRILNTGTFVATPYAGLLLKELGADVIKVEPLTGDPFRVSGYTVNRGMRSLAIDLRSPEGQAAFHRLVTSSDVVIDGMRPGVMQKMNIDYDSLVAHNPEIISMSLSAYGEGGPMSHRPGVDMVMQAESGMMTSWGGKDDPIANSIAINDVATAAFTVLTCVLALHRRNIGGGGQRTWDSLAATSVFLQMESMVRYRGRPPAPTGCSDLRGLDPMHSYYRTKDGWLYLDAPAGYDPCDSANALLMKKLGIEITSSEALQYQLSSKLETGTVDQGLTWLRSVGLRAVKARQVAEVLQDPATLEHEVVHIRPSDDGGTFMVPGRYATFSRTQRRGPLSPPGTGEHTTAVLQDAGFAEDEVQALIDAGVVRTGGPVRHVLPIQYR